MSLRQTDTECLLQSLFEENDAIIYLLTHYVFIFKRLLNITFRIFVYSGLVDRHSGKSKWEKERQR